MANRRQRCGDREPRGPGGRQHLPLPCPSPRPVEAGPLHRHRRHGVGDHRVHDGRERSILAHRQRRTARCGDPNPGLRRGPRVARPGDECVIGGDDRSDPWQHVPLPRAVSGAVEAGPVHDGRVSYRTQPRVCGRRDGPRHPGGRQRLCCHGDTYPGIRRGSHVDRCRGRRVSGRDDRAAGRQHVLLQSPRPRSVEAGACGARRGRGRSIDRL